METHPSKWWYFAWPVVVIPFVAVLDYLALTRIHLGLPGGVTFSLWLKKLPETGLVPWALVLGLLALVFSACWALWAGRQVYRWVGQTYAVTEDRVVQQTGIVRHVLQEIPLRQIRDIDVFQRSLKARVLRYGNLRFKSLSEIDPPGVVSEFAELEHIFDPEDRLAKRSGVEWWVGVPNPFLIERTVEAATQTALAASAPRTSVP